MLQWLVCVLGTRSPGDLGASRRVIALDGKGRRLCHGGSKYCCRAGAQPFAEPLLVISRSSRTIGSTHRTVYNNPRPASEVHRKTPCFYSSMLSASELKAMSTTSSGGCQALSQLRREPERCQSPEGAPASLMAKPGSHTNKLHAPAEWNSRSAATTAK